MSWRGEARAALRAYPRIIRRRTEQQITPSYGGVNVQHSASRTTETAALRNGLSEREERIVTAVEHMIAMQRRYYNAEARLRMVQLVYWSGTHTLQGAAMEVGYNINTIKAWNTEMLAAVWTVLTVIKSREKE